MHRSAFVRLCGLVAVFVCTVLTGRADFREHLGLQLYSLRVQFKVNPLTALDLAKSYGVTYVETAGTAGMSPEAFLAELQARGLQPVAAHVSYDALLADPAAVIAEVKTLGAGFAFVPWIPHEGEFSAEHARAAGAHFERWGAAFREAGIRFGYHPHGYEFAAGFAPGSTLFDDMVALTTPENVCLEMDVFWVVHAGVEPVALLDKYADRWVAMHVKDMRRGAPTGLTTGGAPATDKVAVGEGQIDIAAVLRKAQEIGVRYYFVEDETPVPLKTIPASFAWLRQLEL